MSSQGEAPCKSEKRTVHNMVSRNGNVCLKMFEVPFFFVKCLNHLNLQLSIPTLESKKTRLGCQVDELLARLGDEDESTEAPTEVAAFFLG